MNNYQITEQENRFKYVNYQDLNEYTKDDDMMLILRHINNQILTVDQSIQFESLNELRRLLKFHPELFEFVFSNIYSRVADFLSSSSNQIRQVTLILITELFSSREFEIEDLEGSLVSEWLFEIIPPVVELASTHQNSLFSDQAIKALTELSKFMFHPETIDCLLRILIMCRSDTEELRSKICFDLLDNHIENYDVISMENNLEWSCIFQNFVEIYQLNDFTRMRIRKTMRLISSKLTNDGFIRLLNTNLDDDQQRTILDIYYSS